jgi:LppP/LprE lipoprotein
LVATAALVGCGGGSTGGPSGGPPPLGDAEAAVRTRGYFPVDAAAYDGRRPPAVILGVRKGSADATAQRAFFFAAGRLVGTDTSSDSAGISVAFARPPVIALRYRLFNPTDPQCCPTAGTATVRYRWNGRRLVPLDPIPPASYGASGSRR